MLANLKKAIFTFAKYTGCFHVTRWLYRKRVRVLCYHGFSLENESEFLPKLFIDPEVFSERMRYLHEKGYNVISLDQAMDGLRDGTVPDNAIVLTIDDGFYSVYSQAAPILQYHHFPATLYLTSYYFDRNSPIFSLAVMYMFWSSDKPEPDLASLNIPGLAEKAATGNRQACTQFIIDYGQSRPTHEERVQILENLGALLDVDYEELNKSRKMGLINSAELQELLSMNIDIQMHTHRHDFPLDLKIADYELKKNRRKVDPLLPKSMRHFCYPSGFWSHTQWGVFDKNNIESATTCMPGLMSGKTNHYSIPRFLDGANIDQIDFESELAGFSEFCRLFKLGARENATT